LALSATSPQALAQAPSYDFTYDGRLTDSTQKPYDGPVALSIAFFHQASGRAPVLVVTSGLGAVPLSNGIFQLRVTLDWRLH
jgi:hypothetical protein